jgi:putative sulfotransferase
MLSRMLVLHPEVASISEFFTSIVPTGVAQNAPDGPALWKAISTPRPVHRIWLQLLQRNITIDEFRYPLSRLDRHRASGIPPLLTVSMPELSAEPDALHEELGEYVQSLPVSELGVQFLRVFGWLTERTGRRLWVERSGGSLAFLPILMRHFPNAKYVHIWRDGRDMALSASKFHPIRLGLIAGDFMHLVGKPPWDAFTPNDLSKLPPAYRGLVARGFDLDTFLRLEFPIERFGQVWSGMLRERLPLLAALPQERVIHMRYESLLENPVEGLHRFIEFLDPNLERDDWVKKAAALVRPNAPKWTQLPSSVRARLNAACAPGDEVLGRLGLR